MKKSSVLKRIDRWKILLALPTIGLYFYHGIAVLRGAVDVPLMDEWEYLDPWALPAGLTLRWLIMPLAEHLNVFPRLLVWLLYRTCALDFAVQQALNFLLFGAVLALGAVWTRRILGARSWVFWLFAPFLLSPALEGGHSHGLHASIHLAMLFSLTSLLLIFSPSESRGRLFAGAAAGLCATASFASGHFFSLAGAAVFSYVRLLAPRKNDIRPAIADIAVVTLPELGGLLVAVVAALLLLPIYARHPPPMMEWAMRHVAAGRAASAELPPGASGFDFLAAIWTPPTDRAFWTSFLGLVSRGFGLREPSIWIGLLGLTIVLAPLLWELRVCGLRASGYPLLAATTLGIFGTIAAISLARTWMGDWGLNQSRYAEFCLLLGLVSAAAWTLRLREDPRARAGALSALWLFCALCSARSWDFSVYGRNREVREAGLACVREYYRAGGRGECPQLHPLPLAERLDRARVLRLSFYRRMENEVSAGKRP